MEGLRYRLGKSKQAWEPHLTLPDTHSKELTAAALLDALNKGGIDALTSDQVIQLDKLEQGETVPFSTETPTTLKDFDPKIDPHRALGLRTLPKRYIPPALKGVKIKLIK